MLPRSLTILLLLTVAGCGGEAPAQDAGPRRDAALGGPDSGQPVSGQSAGQLYSRLWASCPGQLGQGGLGAPLVRSPPTVDQPCPTLDILPNALFAHNKPR